ncbi:MAG: cbb3-type cytochrome oxidase assembly protein CcoS [Betaproteobacteria bacterium]|nr:cbb3-type cytochrome oxidase assembly protein CcoS [Betaproteobacteria bacterium]
MDVLYLLIPLSVVLVLLILVGLWWAIHSGQFDRIEGEAERILRETSQAVIGIETIKSKIKCMV